jgi:hypothetical protein
MAKLRLKAAVTLLVLSCAAAQAQIGNGNGSGNTTTAIAQIRNTNRNTATASPTVINTTVSSRHSTRQAPSIVAPGLAAAGVEACLGSASVGGSGAGFGLTIGSTLVDRGCELRLYSRALHAMGYKRAATELLCNDPDVARALAADGYICPTPVVAEGGFAPFTLFGRQ